MPLRPGSAGGTAPYPDASPPNRGRLSMLVVLLSVLSVVGIARMVGPDMVRTFYYNAAYGKLDAEVDVATQGLEKLKPRLEDFSLASRLVAKRVGPSVVSIHKPGFGGEEGQGSGVIVDPEGYIVTNLHVVIGARGLHVRLTDGRTIDATIVGVDEGTDLAVIKIDAENLVAAQWGDSDALDLGDLVWAVGSPFGLDSSITFGIVSAKERRSSSGMVRGAYQEYLQSDVAVNPGNSGGPLVGIDGKIVGINSAIVGPSYRGISFAIPSTIAREQYEAIRKDGFVERGYLGVQPEPVPTAVRRKFGMEDGRGVLVAQVVQDGPAERAGLQPGDIILTWNDHQATDPTLLSRAIAATEIGSTARVEIRRIERSGPVEAMVEVEVGRSPLSVPFTRR
ncbi:S1C family serine protease [Pirellulimonas nuda]|nr:trypsin-like peptidase domain-containing protein [Pirellulimonas nuda]